ncbi:MAG: hypothetical protein V1704_03680 [Candidatus Vogelbacteria bacterium]
MITTTTLSISWQIFFGLLGSIVTILVGLVAIVLYFHQKNDNKGAAASLILQEIRYAEHHIKFAKKNDYNFYLADKLLPTSSWHKNIHLFVNDLKETELDLLSNFYAHAAYLDIVIEKISNKKNDIIIPISASEVIPTDPNLKQFQLNSTKILTDVASKIDLIYNTPAIDKLRVISEKKKHLLFF